MSYALNPKTQFAPVERATFLEAAADFQRFRETALVPLLLDADPIPKVIINDHRQMVFGNRALAELAGVEDLRDLIGLRLGELVGCNHAIDQLAGCGAMDSCRACNAIQATLEAFNKGTGRGDVALRVARGLHEEVLPLKVTVQRFLHEGRAFALMCLEPVVEPAPPAG